MTPTTDLENDLRAALRPTGAPPAASGAAEAYRRFERRRRGTARLVSSLTGAALVLTLGAAVLVPGLLEGRRVQAGAAGPGARVVAGPGSTVDKPAQGFALTVPEGWAVTQDDIDRLGFDGTLLLTPFDGVEAAPPTAAGPAVSLQMSLYDPSGDEGRTPAELESAWMSPIEGEDVTVERRERADGRVYRLAEQTFTGIGSETGFGGMVQAMIEWPFHCADAATCPEVAAQRVVVLMSKAETREAHEAARAMIDALAGALRPVANALPDQPAPGEDADLPYSRSVAVGTAPGELGWAVSARWRSAARLESLDPESPESGNWTAIETRWPAAAFELGGDRVTVEATAGSLPASDGEKAGTAEPTTPATGVPAAPGGAATGQEATQPEAAEFEAGQVAGTGWGVRGACVGRGPGQLATVVGIVDARAERVRVELVGAAPVEVPVFGKDAGFDAGFFAGPALPAGTRAVRLVALDAAGDQVGELPGEAFAVACASTSGG